MYVDKLYTIITCDVANRFYGEPMKSAKLFFREKLKLSDAKPTNYIFQNRNKGESRFIANMDELFKITVAMYPQYDWQKDNYSNYDLYYVSRFFNSIVCLVSPTGSNVANVLFMQPETVAVVVYGSWMDIPTMCACVSCEVYMVLLHSKGNHWSAEEPWIVDIKAYKESIGRAAVFIKKFNQNE